MQEIINKASVLIEALPYIQDFRNSIVVIKFGGSAMEDPAHVSSAMADVAFMECVGMRPVVVHGGGKAISRGMKDHGIEPVFLKGLRVTCEKTIEVVEKVIKKDINPQLVALLRKMGAAAEPVHGEDIFTVERKTEIDEATGQTLDWGFVGEPSAVRTEPVTDLLERETIPVITPLGLGADGKIHNVNADSAAAAVAGALKARKLVFLSDVQGLLRNPNDPESLMTTLKVDEVEYLISEGIIGGGMLPKVQSGVQALHAGVRKVHMIDGRMPHSLLLEIFTAKGVGTEIVHNEENR
jgi:acetylglutamate kinase